MKNRKALILLFSVLFLSLLLVGCLPSGTTPTPEPENELPIITSTPITVATVGFVYSYDVQATDPDGDTLIYTLSVAPSGMYIDYPTGIISWSPSSLQLEENEVVVRVYDGTSSVTQSFIITVSLIGRILESIETLPATMELSVAQSLPITSVIATYDNEDEIDIALADCTYAPVPTGIVSVVDGVITGLAAGTATITVSYIEGAVTTTDTVVVTVIPRVLESITVLPATMELSVTQFLPITSVTASYNYGTAADIALADCTYASVPTGIVNIANGVITGADVGTTTITVSYTEGTVTETGTVEVTVVLAANLKLTPASQSVVVSSQVTIYVEVEDVQNLMAGTITLNFNNTKLAYSSNLIGAALPGSFFSNAFMVGIPVTGGSVKPEFLNLVDPDPSGSGTLFALIFDTLDTGTTNITFGTTGLYDETGALTETTMYHTTGSGCSVTIN